MISNSLRYLKIGAASLLVGLTVTACAERDLPPQQVAASNPTVTYKYRGDQELVQANQSASFFCSQYQSTPRSKSFSNDQDGNRVVVFECLRTVSQPALPPQYNPSLGYTYMTDQELVDASRNAQVYCMNNGSHQVTSDVTTNANGTRSVSFQCGPTGYVHN